MAVNTTQEPISNFTSCFRNTILVWIPCIFLWTFSPLEIYYIYKSKSRDIPYNFFIVLKMALITLIVFIHLKNITCAFTDCVLPLYFHNAALQTATFILYLILTRGNLKKGIRSSGVLFCFSLISVICAIPQLIHFITPVNQGPEVDVDPIVFAIYFTSILLILSMNCFSDPKPLYSICETTEKSCPANSASFISKTFLLWFNQYNTRNNKNPIEENLWNLDVTESVLYLSKKLNKSSKNSTRKNTELTNDPKNHKKIVIKSILKAFGTDCIVLLFWTTSVCICYLSIPVMFSLIIVGLKNNESAMTLNLYAISFVMLAIFHTLTNIKLFSGYSTLMIKIQAILMSMIYEKVMCVTDRAKSKFTSGEIVTLITADVQNVSEGVKYAFYFWLAPVQICIIFYYIWKLYGPGTIVIIGTIFLLVPIYMYFTSAIKKLTYQEKLYKNQRGKFLQDLMAGIKILKMYAWESSFVKKAACLRFQEYKNFTMIGQNQIAMATIFNLVPSAMTSVTFAIFLCWGNGAINVEKAFTTIAFYNAIKRPMQLISTYLINVMQGFASAKNIDNFLNLQELNTDLVSHDVTDEALIISEGTFSWIGSDSQPILRNLNLEIAKGSLISVVGPVGAGKSSLISAFLGELYKIAGYVNVNGKTAYVPQQAWILNTTFKENVTLGNTNNILYKKAIQACALIEDIQTFPAGELAEIGEKGINLSGGQKQRINIARAICCDADIYFFDDSLSAVDFRVSKHIFENVLGSNGLLRSKTRILVTHNTSFLPQTDYVIFMKDGHIAKMENYHDIVKKKDYFSEFLLTSLKDTEDEPELAAKSDTCNKLETQICQLHIQKSDNKTKETVFSPNVQKIIVDEKLEKGNVKKSVYLYLIEKFGITKITAIFSLNLSSQFFALFTRIWLLIWINWNEHSDQNMSQLFCLLIFVSLGLIEGLTSFITHILVMSGVYKTSQAIYNEFVEAILHWPLWLLDSTPVGRILNRATTDTYILDDHCSKRLVSVLENGNKYLTIILVCTYANPINLVIFAIFFILLRIIQNWYAKLASQLQRINANNKSPLSSFMVETLQGLHSIRANGYHEYFISQCYEKIDLYNTGAKPFEINNRWFALRVDILIGLVVTSVIYCILLQRDSLGLGVTILALSYIVQSTSEISWFFQHFLDIENGLITVERLKEFIDCPKENYKSIHESSVPKEWPCRGEIRFENYKLRYRKQNELVLKGLNFTVRSAEKIGIVGRTGAGKSSMIIGLLRMVEPDEGTIFIDDVDITRIDLEILRSHLTIIPQDPVLFLGTLRFNLDPDEIYNDENVWNALERSHLKSYVQKLPKGLEYPIEESGGNLSCGQRQLLCLARALLRKSKILLLDEATASVDLDTDELIQRTIRDEFTECTVLTIAHRLNTIQDYDRILVLENGGIVEYDTPSRLIDSEKSVFYEIMLESGLISR